MYAVNGATGKVFGSLPVSVPKLLALALGLFLGVGALLTLIAYTFLFGAESLMASVAFGGIFGVVTAAITAISIFRSYNKGLHAPIYPLEKYANLKLTHATDVFLHSTVTKVRINNSSKKR